MSTDIINSPTDQNADDDSSKYLSKYGLPSENRPMTLEEVDDINNLIKECGAFVDTTRNSLAIPFAAFERVRQWRVKRRESKAMVICEQLLPKIKITEVCSYICLLYYKNCFVVTNHFYYLFLHIRLPSDLQ